MQLSSISLFPALLYKLINIVKGRSLFYLDLFQNDHIDKQDGEYLRTNVVRIQFSFMNGCEVALHQFQRFGPVFNGMGQFGFVHEIKNSFKQRGR